MASMFAEYGAKDYKRPTEWIAIFMLLNGLTKVPSSAWGAKYASPASVYRAKTSGQITRLNTDDGWLYRPVMKECSNCLEVYPEGGNMWEQNERGRNGLHSHCKNCRREYYQQRYRRNKPNRRQQPLPA